MIGTVFSVIVDGVRHPARYHVAGKRVKVSSIYGELVAPLGEEVPSAVANRLLREMVRLRAEEKVSMAQRNVQGD